jgi:hypothetical protein
MEYTAGRGTTALGIIGTVLGSIGAAGATNILGGVGLNNGAACHESMPVSRYEAQQQARIAELETEVKLRDSNIYTDSKLNDFRNYVDSRFAVVNDKLCAQAVHNATNDAVLGCMQSQIAQLMGLTKLVVPNASVCPGWGNVTVAPAAAPTTAG